MDYSGNNTYQVPGHNLPITEQRREGEGVSNQLQTRREKRAAIN
jgi:hypothetical protein